MNNLVPSLPVNSEASLLPLGLLPSPAVVSLGKGLDWWAGRLHTEWRSVGGIWGIVGAD